MAGTDVGPGYVYVLGTIDNVTIEGYVGAEEATRVSGLGLLDVWLYRGVGFGIIIFPLSQWLLFLLRLQIYKFRIWIIKFMGSIIVA